jgi:predicted nucleic acid-binding protein
MNVLDTNVISEAMKPSPDATVLAWLNNQATETHYLSNVTLAELLFGIGELPTGKRNDLLAQAPDGLTGLCRDRIPPFDTDAARHHARLAVKAHNAGRGFATPDGYIVASRDTAPYEAAGVTVVNPWVD